jgi:hypothetical protein
LDGYLAVEEHSIKLKAELVLGFEELHGKWR